jgi:hypothetical protein
MQAATLQPRPSSSVSPRLARSASHGRPSVEALLATTGTIESLDAMRRAIAEGLASGEIDPAPKTLERWTTALFTRVLELMALQPRQAPYIYNVTLGWPKPAGLQEALAEQVRLVTAPLPSEAELLRIRGTPIEGFPIETQRSEEPNQGSQNGKDPAP